MKVIITVFSLILLFTTSAFCAEVTGEIKTFGVVEFKSEPKEQEASDTPTGVRLEVKRAVVANKTDTIPAILNTAFGIEYIIYGLRPNSKIKLRKVITYPPIKSPDGRTRKTETSEGIHLVSKEGTIKGVDGYFLGKNYLLVPGAWTIELWYENDMIINKSFKVVHP